MILNTGTIEKIEGTGETRIGAEINNDGVVKGESGSLQFGGGGIPGGLRYW